MTNFFQKYKRIIMYIIFSALTEAVFFVSYDIVFNLFLDSDILRIPNIPSAIIARVLYVTLAYITNKMWVFPNRFFDRKTIIKEVTFFLFARIATWVMFVGLMCIAVDSLHWNVTVWKLIGNVMVVIMDYIASDLIFSKKSLLAWCYQ